MSFLIQLFYLFISWIKNKFNNVTTKYLFFPNFYHLNISDLKDKFKIFFKKWIRVNLAHISKNRLNIQIFLNFFVMKVKNPTINNFLMNYSWVYWEMYHMWAFNKIFFLKKEWVFNKVTIPSKFLKVQIKISKN